MRFSCRVIPMLLFKNDWKQPLYYHHIKTIPDLNYRGWDYNLCTLFLKFLKLLIFLLVLYLFYKADQFSESKLLNRSKATSKFLEELKRKSEDCFGNSREDESTRCKEIETSSTKNKFLMQKSKKNPQIFRKFH